MSWETGNQIPRKKEFISNEDLLKKKGFLEEREAKLLFYEFLRNNTTFATDLITGVQLFPFQHMAIKSMLESDYFFLFHIILKQYVLFTDFFKSYRGCYRPVGSNISLRLE